MEKNSYSIVMKGDFQPGTSISATALQAALNLAIEGSQRALRMRIKGSSDARGLKNQKWSLAAELEFTLIKEGSREINLKSNVLFMDPSIPNDRRNLFGEGESPLGLFMADIEAMHQGNGEGLDQQYVESIYKLSSKLLSHGVDEFSIKNSSSQTPIFSQRDMGLFAALNDSYTKELIHSNQDVRGRLTRLDSVKRTFLLNTSRANEQGKVTGQYRVQGELKQTQVESLGAFLNKNVIVQGTFALRKDQSFKIKDAIIGLQSLEGKSPTRKSLPERFEIFRHLEDGWKGKGRGKSFDDEWIDEIERFVTRLLQEYPVEPPYIFASQDGEIELEWKYPPFAVQAVFETEDKLISVISTKVGPDVSADDPYYDVDIKMGTSHDVGTLAKFLIQQRQKHLLHTDSQNDQNPQDFNVNPNSERDRDSGQQHVSL